MPKITIAIPIFNAEKHLVNCIESVLRQTFMDIQIILINDGSTDESGQICDIYAAKDPRINVYHCNNNGVSIARNLAIEKARGEYISFIDADDEIDELMIENLYAQIKNTKADIAICGHVSVYRKNKKLYIVKHEPPNFNGTTKEFLELIELFLDSECVQGPCAKLYRTNLIKRHGIKFPNQQSFGEDTIFVYNYLKYCNRIVSVDKCFYSYMKRTGGSLSSSFREDKVEIYIQLYKELELLLGKFGVFHKHELLEKRICTSVISCIGELYNNSYYIKRIERINYINRTISNKKVLSSFKSQRDNNYKFTILNYLFQNKSVFLIDLLFLIKGFINF